MLDGFTFFMICLSGCVVLTPIVGFFVSTFTRQRVDQQILGELLALAEKTQVFAKRDAMFAGKTINTSENRQVLHPALRDRQH